MTYTKERSEREKKEEIEANIARSHQLGLQRRTEIEIQNREHIQIPIPSYGYGAVRRGRFAFGRISPLQTRKNTAYQLRNEFVENLNEIEEPPEEDFPVAEEEIFEEDFYQN